MAKRQRDTGFNFEELTQEEREALGLAENGGDSADPWFQERLDDDLESYELECENDIEALLDELAYLSPEYPLARRRWVLRAWLKVRQERSERHLPRKSTNTLNRSFWTRFCRRSNKIKQQLIMVIPSGYI